jgi:hypothetical protein
MACVLSCCFGGKVCILSSGTEIGGSLAGVVLFLIKEDNDDSSGDA